MPGPIIITDFTAATVSDLLQGTRLQTVPAGGIMTFQFIADLNDVTNNFAVTIQMPNGDTPINAQKVPGVNPSLAGVLDERQLFQYSSVIAQGGHCVVTLTETGTAICTYRIVYSPG